ncbi:rhodanese-like domain-containing protein [Candidatus Thioglobus autotrophicus]|uniref:rhodanese-like domain-containing protein n=1 Tax=Candidatus Thioglobus autotrophicus TaxID=1705394 RepID=UPI00299E8D08|nr:rhodanese-like domain-containing protein [Candidatus Thioglobus autotrophicus]WPE17505.1 rhodanese-like domain-containing protein [Candidatus Thioglobus autotrophicus]
MKLQTLVLSTAVAAVLTSSAAFAAEKVTGKAVGIVKGVMEVAGISRNQDNKATIDPAFAKTSRPCPPFCIQPTAPFAPAAVETVTELDVIHAARDAANGDTSALVVDARTPGWVKKGTIPHAVNVPFTKLNSKALAKDPMAVVDILTGTFGVKDLDGVLDYNNAKTLYLFCNGSWCGQSPASIRALLTMGYPENKIKYYRGGMNAWKSLGLTTK